MTSARLKWPAAYGLARSDDDRMIACIGRSVIVIDMRKRARLSMSRPFSHPASGSFSPIGDVFAVKSTRGEIAIIDPKTGDVLTNFKNRRDGEGSGVFFSADGRELIDGSWDGNLTVRRSADGAIAFRDCYAGEMLTRVSHDRERQLWLVTHSPKVKAGENQIPPGYVTLHRWPIVGSETQAFAFNMRIETAQVSPDGTRFCFFQKRPDRRVHVARVSDGQIIASSSVVDPGGTGSELAWSADGKQIAAVADGQFLFMRADDLSVSATRPMEYPSSAAFMQNGSELVLGSWKTSVCVSTAIEHLGARGVPNSI